MAIQIKQVTVIDDSRNFINLASIRAGAAGTATWTSGLNKVNFGDGILYGPGDPNGNVIALESAGDIKIDGILKCSGVSVPLA